MRRIIFEWHGIKFYSYPLLLYFGTLIGICAGTYGASLRGLNPGRVSLAMLLLFPVGLVGARLLFVITHWRFYWREPHRLWLLLPAPRRPAWPRLGPGRRAVSNIHDQLSRGAVLDFLELGWWPVFNLADVAITLG